MRVFSLKKFKKWCEENHELYSNWAEECDGHKIYGNKNDTLMHCIGRDGQVYYVSEFWIVRR